METENQGEPTTLYMETAVKMVHVCVRVRREQKSMHVYTGLNTQKRKQKFNHIHDFATKYTTATQALM